MTVCPCCHQLVAGRIDPGLLPDIIRLPNQERIVLGRLSRDFGRPVTAKALLDAVYGDRIDGGPDHARIVVAIAVTRLKKKLAPLGLSIIGDRRSGQRVLLWSESVAEPAVSGEPLRAPKPNQPHPTDFVPEEGDWL